MDIPVGACVGKTSLYVSSVEGTIFLMVVTNFPWFSAQPGKPHRKPVPSLLLLLSSLQSCPTLCDPIDGSPPGSPVPEILQARTLEWVAISFSNVWKWKVQVKSLSRVRLIVTPWTAAYQAPPSMGFSRQEYWSGVPLPSPVPSLLVLRFSLSIQGGCSSHMHSYKSVPAFCSKNSVSPSAFWKVPYTHFFPL